MFGCGTLRACVIRSGWTEQIWSRRVVYTIRADGISINLRSGILSGMFVTDLTARALSLSLAIALAPPASAVVLVCYLQELPFPIMRRTLPCKRGPIFTNPRRNQHAKWVLDLRMIEIETMKSYSLAICMT